MKPIPFKTLLTALLSSMLFLLSCKPGDGPSDPGQPPKLLWKHPLTETLELASTISPAIGGGVVAYTHKRMSDSPPSPLMGLDAADGSLKWRWEDFDPGSRSIGPTDRLYSYRGIMLYSTDGPVYGINLKTGTTRWKNVQFESGLDDNFNFSDIFLQVFEGFPDNSLGNVYLGLANAEAGAWQMVYSLHGDSVWRPRISTSIGKISTNGDTLVYLTGSWYRPDIVFARGFLIGYNITADTTLFQHETGEEEEYVYGMLNLYEDKLLAGGTNLRCYHAHTGEQLWEKKLQDGVQAAAVWTSGPVIAGDQVLVNTSGLIPRLFLFNISNGQLVWRSGEIRTNSHLYVHQQTIYATGDRELKGVSLETGKLLWSIPSPHAREFDGAFFSPALNLDRENNRLYTSDYLYALCYEL